MFETRPVKLNYYVFQLALVFLFIIRIAPGNIYLAKNSFKYIILYSSDELLIVIIILEVLVIDEEMTQ